MARLEKILAIVVGIGCVAALVIGWLIPDLPCGALAARNIALTGSGVYLLTKWWRNGFPLPWDDKSNKTNA